MASNKMNFSVQILNPGMEDQRVSFTGTGIDRAKHDKVPEGAGWVMYELKMEGEKIISLRESRSGQRGVSSPMTKEGKSVSILKLDFTVGKKWPSASWNDDLKQLLIHINRANNKRIADMEKAQRAARIESNQAFASAH